MRTIWILIITSLVGLTACQTSAPNDALDRFTKAAPRLTLPADFLLNGEPEIATYEVTASDTAILPEGTQVLGWTRPMEEITLVFYSIRGGDYLIPAVISFKGQTKVDDKQLGLGACGALDCGVECEEYLHLLADGHFLVEVIKEVRPCVDGELVPDAPSRSQNQTQTGKVTEEGKLNLVLQ